VSDLNKILRELVKQGFAYRTTSGSHYLIKGPDGRTVTTLPSTPSDARSLKNAIAVLRRAGFKWGGR